MQYTKSLTDIYFLNDKNIASSLIDDSIQINAVPALSLLNEKYNELTAYDEKLSNTISSLDYSSELSIDGGISIITKVEQLDGKISLSATQLLSSHVDGLSDFVRSKINELTFDVLSDANKFVRTIKQNNGKIIATFDKVCSADIDGQLEKDQVYGLTATLGAIETSANLLCAEISALSTNLSNATNAVFVHLSGDTIQYLSVATNISVASNSFIDGDAKINGKLAVGNNANAIAVDSIALGLSSTAADTHTFVWNGNDSGSYSSNGAHTFNINPLAGINGVYIGDKTLCSIISSEVKISSDEAIRLANDYTDTVSGNLSTALTGDIQSAIQHLSCETSSATTGRIIDYLGQDNGIINFDYRYILSSDIPDLPESKIINLEGKYVLTSEFKTSRIDNDAHLLSTSDLVFTRGAYAGSPDCILLSSLATNSVIGKVEVDDFIRDGMISSVIYKTDLIKVTTTVGGTTIEREYGGPNNPYLEISWNSAAGNNITYVELSSLIDIYEIHDDEKGLKLEDGHKFYIDYNVVASRELVDPYVDYVNALKGTAAAADKGIIAKISDDISTLYDIDVRRLKFDGHITHTDSVTTLSSLIFENRDLATEDKIRNNSVFNVKFKDAELSDGTKPFTTDDGVTLGYGDMIIFHDHDDTKKEFIEFVDAINHAEIIKAGVSRYEFFDNIQFTNNNFVWLSGNNNELCSHAISGNNEFMGSNFFKDNTTFFKDISVDNGISCGNVTILTNSIDISNKITIDDELINIEDSMKINKDRIEIVDNLSVDANQISSTNPLAVGIVSSLYLRSSTSDNIYRLTIDDSTFGTPMMNFDKI